MSLPTGEDFVKHILAMDVTVIKNGWEGTLKRVLGTECLKDFQIKALILALARMESAFGKYMTIDKPVESYMERFNNDEWLSKPHGYFHIMGANIQDTSLGAINNEETFTRDCGTVELQIDLLLRFILQKIVYSEIFENTSCSSLMKFRAAYYGGLGALKHFQEHGEFPKSDEWDINKNVDRFLEIFKQMEKRVYDYEAYQEPTPHEKSLEKLISELSQLRLALDSFILQAQKTSELLYNFVKKQTDV